LVESWEYFVLFGFSLAGIATALNWLILPDSKYKKKLDKIGIDIKVNYLEQLIHHIIQRENENPKGITDAEINAELHRIFIISEKLKACEYLDTKNSDYVKHFLFLLIAIGIAIAGYPFIMAIMAFSETIIYLYGSLLISFLYSICIISLNKYTNKKELKHKLDDLETHICWDMGIIEETDEHA